MKPFRTTYRKKLFLYFLMIFSLFTVAIVLVQQNREKNYKNAQFLRGMDIYASLISRYLSGGDLLKTDLVGRLPELIALLPSDLRVSIINSEGQVLFDNKTQEIALHTNHLSRPEIAQSIIYGTGSHIRRSSTTGITYYYYSRHTDGFFIRVALPYDHVVKPILRTDDLFLYIILLLFFIGLISILYLSDRFGKSVSRLRDFIVSAENNRPDYDRIDFPDTELGEIGHRIVTNYRLLNESRNLLEMERGKLIRHFQYSDEGICIFSPEGDKVYANSRFIQHLNSFSDEPSADVDILFRIGDFVRLRRFLEEHRPVNPQSTVLPVYEEKLSSGIRYFEVRLLIFTDNSYEITLNNITGQEKSQRLKQEITHNIAHELKTPVTIIRGYLETLLEQPGISVVQQHQFIERAYTQTLRLSDVIRDVGLISKLEEAPDRFERHPLSLHDLVRDVLTEHSHILEKLQIRVSHALDRDIILTGNRSLLHSIFWNLLDNAIHYAGTGIHIWIHQYGEDDDFYYFSFADNGPGVRAPELDKIFIRFYRVDEGRSREHGGSGLGLSIVKNAVLFHRGQITARNRPEGGLEFLFSLAKRV